MFFSFSLSLFPDNQFGVSVFHRDLNPFVLFEDSPQLSSARDKERDGGGALPQRHLLDAGQVADFPPRRLLLRGACVQHLVHL